MARRLVLLLLGTAGALALAIGVCLVAKPTVPLDWLAPRIRPGLEAAWGGPVDFEGSRLTLSLQPTLLLEHVRLADPDLSISGIRLRSSIPALLGGVVKVTEASVEDVRLELPDGGGGLSGGATGETAPLSIAVDLPWVAIQRLRIVPPAGDPVEVHGLELEAARSRRIRLRGRVRHGRHAVAVAMEGGTLAELLSGETSWPWSAVVTSGVGRISLDGRLGRFWEDPAARGRLMVRWTEMPGYQGTGAPVRVTSGASATLDLAWQGSTEEALRRSVQVHGWVDDLRLEAEGQCLDVETVVVRRDSGGPWRVTVVGTAADRPFDVRGRLDALPAGMRAGLLEGRIAAGWGRARLAGSVRYSYGRDDASHALRVALQEAGSFPLGGFGRWEGLNTAVISAEWQGRSGSEALATLRAEATVKGGRLGIGHADQGTAEARLDEVELSWRAGEVARVDVTARLGPVPIRLTLEGPAPAGRSLAEPWAAWAVAEAADVRMNLQMDGEGAAWRANLAVQGEHSGRWGAWLGAQGLPDLPFRLQGTVARTATAWTGVLDRVQWGGSVGTVHARGGPERPEIRIDVDALRVDEWTSGPRSAATSAPRTRPTEVSRVRQALPPMLRIPEFELVLRVDEVIGLPQRLKEVACRLVAVDGRLAESAYRMNLAGSWWEGAVSGDLRGDRPFIDLLVQAEDVELHQLLGQAGKDAEVEAYAGRVDARVHLQGARLDELVRDSAVSLHTEDVVCRIPGPEGMIRIALPRLQLVREGERLAAEAAVSINGAEMQLAVERARPQALPGGRTLLPLAGRLTADGLQAEFEGVLHTPLAELRADLRIAATSEAPAQLGRAWALPAVPRCPIAIQGRFAGRAGAYRLEDIEARVGETRLVGEAAYGGSTNGVSWRLDLASPALELTDLLITNLVAGGASPDGSGKGGHAMGVFSLLADEVYCGGTPLGRLQCDVRIDPDGVKAPVLRLESEDHVVDVGFHYVTAGEGMHLAAALVVSNFAYGALGPLLPVLANSEGRLFLEGAMAGSGVRGRGPLLPSEGELGFAWFPEGFKSDVLDLWAIGILRAVTGLFTGGNRSQVECVAGRFEIADGIWRPAPFYLDTTRVRVRGAGFVDPVNDRIRFKLTPRAKQRAFLHLATPVVVRGSLSDPEVQVSRAGLVMTATRLYFWVLSLADGLLRREIPAHDFDGYMRMMQGGNP